MKQVLVLHWGVNCLDRGNRPIKSRFAPLIEVRIAIVSERFEECSVAQQQATHGDNGNATGHFRSNRKYRY
ncbi:hypothetical protein KTE91_05960 [Burkholderia multivorans]|uniref:hypothetical protein n=1 Tax=Burkholderia multivorans TaxID=87883 RepID=UPI001C230055|nr:hypothetical protein [Burkholderia multivorans]MBU9434634.1 hypothetical protein [Burkholderia multivorans]